VRVIAGTYEKVTGPVKELVIDVEYLDVHLKRGQDLAHKARKGYTSFCYVLSGEGGFGGEKLAPGQLGLFLEAGTIAVQSITDLHYIFVSGKRLNEPVAWGGPIVMNTRQELDLAFRELDEGTFIKK
ncbi:MAG: pirin-like C-terminal cupin domain-containing protein, partial [Candidatus Margulisiibacteriota bacterium]